MTSAHSNLPAAPQRVDLQAAYAGRNVLVAGGDGFLGINFAIALHRLKARVTLLSRAQAPRAGSLAVRHVRADLIDVDAVALAVDGQDFVIDAAGVAGAVGSNTDPVASTDKECRPHLTLFAAAARAASRPVVAFLSSRLVYGKPDRLPVDETHPVRPASFYAVHKLTLEHYLQVLAATHGLRSVIFRLSNPYGPHWPLQRKSYGLINQFIARALTGEPIDIFGDGAQQRDYIHVDDVEKAVLSGVAAEHATGETFNLGGTVPISIREAIEGIAAEVPGTVIRFKPWPADYLAVETGNYQTDLSKLHRYLSLPAQADFRHGLRRTLHDVRAGIPPAAG